MNEPEFTRGLFVTKKKTRPAIKTRLHIPALRLEVHAQLSVTGQHLQQLTATLIRKLVDAAPEQNLVCDTQRSNLAHDSEGKVFAVIVLVPQTPFTDIDEVYQELSELARKTAADLNVEVVDSREQVTH